MKFGLKAGPFSWSDITKDDIMQFFSFGHRKKDVYLDYKTSTIVTSYANSNINWLQIEREGETLRAPYDVVFDYRNRNENFPWGSFRFVGNYEFPPILAKHKESIVDMFKKEKRLPEANNPLPRVSKFHMIKGKPYFLLQKASYAHQVGTNLTLDFPLAEPINMDDKKCATVREWDMVQAGHEKRLPEFHESKLANTIGVSIGVTAKLNKLQNNNDYLILRRKRANNVAVYPNMLHVPFSFALDMNHFDKEKGEIKDLIFPDFRDELSRELGLEFNAFNPPQILAFCRDLVRGGKPQFFFEMKARLTFEELQKKLKKCPEFAGNIEVEELKGTKDPYSPELEAFTLLKSVNKE